jgi:hypothetical protein
MINRNSADLGWGWATEWINNDLKGWGLVSGYSRNLYDMINCRSGIGIGYEIYLIII